MSRIGRVFKDRDYLLTVGKLYFCVVGYVHPPDRIIAYLKYTSSSSSDSEGRNNYKRALPFYTIPHIEETFIYLQRNHLNYIFHDKSSGLSFSAVPLTDLEHHLCPEEKLGILSAQKRKDSLELKTIELASKLSKESGVPLRFFGVTGSILLGIHNLKFSDVDLTIYGKENSLKVREAILRLYAARGELKRFTGGRLKNWCDEKARLYPISVSEAEQFYNRIWNRGVYKNTMFSIHPTRLDHEVKEKYGQKIVQQEDVVEAEATIKDADESIFMPATYRLEKSLIKRGLNVPVDELVSYEGLYGGIFRKGEDITVKGTLEHVYDSESDEDYWRITVGSLKAKGNDYIKPI